MVKVTETYNPTTKVAEDKTLEVVFTRTTNTQTTELQTGMDTYVATAEEITIERLTDEPGRVVIKNVPNYEFRALNGDILLQDWTSSVEDTVTFTFEESITNVTIESRSTDASISFTAFEGFTYELKSGETMIKENLKDNQEGDLNQKDGVITIKGLIQGLPYNVHYEGNVVLETITQDEVDGQVDKLYVLNDYTFISFVHLDLNPRPEAPQLEKDYDGVAIYDKTNYFSDSTRQSFVADNDTGFIYKIENINIANLSGGCVNVEDTPFPFDMRVNNQSELEFFSLYENPSINKNGCIKDKFGTKYINNNVLNEYDENTNTLYYVSTSNPDTHSGISYWLTSTGEVVKRLSTYSNYFVVMMANNRHRFVEIKDDFEIYLSIYEDQSREFVYKASIKNNLLKKYVALNKNINAEKESQFYDYMTGDGTGYHKMFFSKFQGGDVYTSDVYLIDDGVFRDNSKKNYYFYDKYQIAIFHVTENNQTKTIYFKNSLDELEQNFLMNYQSNSSAPRILTEIDNARLFPLNYRDFKFTRQNAIQISSLNGATIENGKLRKVTLSGNVYYDLVPELVNGEWVITPYVTGTYVAPPPSTITFQPINK
jgi:hypothetical protein